MANLNLEGQSWLEILPFEAISVIASYLNARDISKCCATSSTMRELFNDNSIWRPRCDKQLANYLEKTPCKVDPPFFEPNMRNSSLSPLPQWRISHMRETHLWNNWRRGRFKEEAIKCSTQANFHMFYSNDCVIARYSDRIELLDVKLSQGSKIVSIPSTIDCKIEFANNLIVLLDGNKVQVFELDLDSKTAECKHLYYFENSVKFAVNKTHASDGAFHVPEHKFRGKCLIVGKFLLGVLERETTFHIWDLESGNKLKEEANPLKECPVLDMVASSNMHVVLALEKAKQKTKIFLAYSLKELKFLPFRDERPLNCEYSVYKDFIIIMFQTTVQIFNFVTATVLSTMSSQSFPKAIKNNLLFIQNEKLTVFSLKKNTSDVMPLNDVKKFEILGSKFLQIRSDGWKRNVWEIDEMCHLLKKTETNLNFDSCSFFLNKACNRYIVRYDKAYILNFW